MYKNLIFMISVVLFSSIFVEYTYGNDLLTTNEDYDKEYHPVYIDNFDSYGQKIQLIFYEKPRRVIAVGENAAKTILALGLSDSLVAIVETVENGKLLKELYPLDFESENFLVLSKIDKETILMLEPDLIIAWQSRFNDKMLGTTYFWHQRNVMTYIPPSTVETDKPKTLSQEYQYILDIGKIFNIEAETNNLVSEMNLRIDQAANNVKYRSSPTVLILAFSRDLIISYGANSLPGDIVKKAGGVLLTTPRYISYEELLQLNPDVMFIVRLDSKFKETENSILQKKVLRNLNCVKNKRIYALSIHWLYNSSVSSIDGIQAVIKGLYGEL
ncbi:MAG: ABC transporter substrate-binding protein [Deltaproteobacteria bacterium]|jgi:iron complex transport system substrate-binding protein|nr:ABC transporter substrate-binding protein [Deltaproteobacteria bacterium]